MTSVKNEARDRLAAAAREAARCAYAPYSKFRVGAAVESGDGQVFVGANVENASFGLTLCAERSALSAAVSAGAEQIVAIAVACIDAEVGDDKRPLLPCGACRQWLAELAPGAEIIIAGLDRRFRLGELLPFPFFVPRE